jgi:NAD(P)-dependent dehydrogenase (short-subunit alcohol dehydrogenase family)
MNDASNIDVIADYTAREDLLQDRVVLVTGANRGIGRAVALAAAAAGARVVLSGRNVSGLEAVDDEIRAAGGQPPGLLPLDLMRARIDDYRAAAAALDSEFGKLDGLAHIAGILGELSTIEHYPPMTWHNVMHVNVNAPFLLTQALLPLLYKSDDGAAVYASSSVGRRGRAHWGAYSVSKFALEGFAQTLADESEGRLRVNCVNPGATRTAMRRAAFPAEAADTLATPEQVAAAFVYCLGPDSDGVTGRSFNAQA